MPHTIVDDGNRQEMKKDETRILEDGKIGEVVEIYKSGGQKNTTSPIFPSRICKIIYVNGNKTLVDMS